MVSGARNSAGLCHINQLTKRRWKKIVGIVKWWVCHPTLFHLRSKNVPTIPASWYVFQRNSLSVIRQQKYLNQLRANVTSFLRWTNRETPFKYFQAQHLEKLIQHSNSTRNLTWNMVLTFCETPNEQPHKFCPLNPICPILGKSKHIAGRGKGHRYLI